MDILDMIKANGPLGGGIIGMILMFRLCKMILDKMSNGLNESLKSIVTAINDIKRENVRREEANIARERRNEEEHKMILEVIKEIRK